MIGETFMELLKDPAHWGFELTVEMVTGIAAFLWGRAWVKRHDRIMHSDRNGKHVAKGDLKNERD